MNEIVIVDDILQNGLRIAEQLKNWIVQEHLENNIAVRQILLFNSEDLNREIYKNKIAELSLHVESICLWNFDKKLDSYMADVEKHTIFLIDYLLREDGSDGIPAYRVNIRYAKRQNEERKKKLFFYTLTGIENFKLLCDLVGIEHVIPSKYENGKVPSLDLQHNSKLLNEIKNISI